LSEIIQNRAEFEQLRSRLRHHDLTNNFLLAAETIPSSDEALSQGLQDLKEKIQRYSDRDSIFKQLDDDIVKLCDLACSLKISALSSVIFPDLEVKRPDSILSWVDELKKTSNSLKEAASKIKALDDNSKPNDIRKAIKEFINSLKQSIEALKAPRSK
jgi:DNA repair exonuclease SbcCD ATPase subunit